MRASDPTPTSEAVEAEERTASFASLDENVAVAVVDVVALVLVCILP